MWSVESRYSSTDEEGGVKLEVMKRTRVLLERYEEIVESRTRKREEKMVSLI